MYRQILLTLLTLSFLYLNNVPVWADITTSLIGHWSFDEGKPGLGTVTLNGVTSTEGKTGGALHFDGVNDYVSVSNTKLGLMNDFTIAAWVKLDAKPNGNNPVWSMGNLNQIMLRSLQHYITFSDASKGLISSDSSNVDTWIHVVVAKTGSKGSYYRNGKLAQTSENAFGSAAVDFSSFLIGKSGLDWFKGDIDDLRIYNGTLSPSQIDQLYILAAGDLEAPTMPQKLSVRPLSSTSIELTWDPSSDNVGVKGYKIYRSEGEDSFVLIADVTDTFYIDTGLTTDHTYSYKITAYDAMHSFSQVSPAVSVAPMIPPRRNGNILYATSGSALHVQAAINYAQDGDTVVIPEGVWTWRGTETVTIDLISNPRNLIIQGAGKDKTIIVDEVVKDGVHNILSIYTVEGKSFRLTGMTLKGGEVRNLSGLGRFLMIAGTSKSWRMDNVKIDHPRTTAVLIYGDTHGVIDHCTFDLDSVAVYIIHDRWGGVPYGDASWSEPLTLGTTKAIYVEHNEFNWPYFTGRSEVTDGFAGSRYVVRYNQIKNGIVSHHGTESGGRNRGGRSFEVYGNNFIGTEYQGTKPIYALYIRSGTGVVFDNTLKGYSTLGTLINMRDFDPSHPWGMADGLQFFDQNSTPKIPESQRTGKNSVAFLPEKDKFGYYPPSILTDTTKNWGDLRGYTVINKTKGWGGFILSNTATTITTRFSGHSLPLFWDVNDDYEITAVDMAMDQAGAGASDALCGDNPVLCPGDTNGKFDQTKDPVYEWSNVLKSDHGEDIDVNMSAYLQFGYIKEGRDFFNDKTLNIKDDNKRPGYTPYGDHPLVSDAYWENLVNNPDLEAPSSPLNVAAAAISMTQINLSWSASTDNQAVVGYRIYRSNGGSAYVQIATVTNGSFYSNTGLAAGITYSYKIKAYDAMGNESPFSVVVSAMTQITPSPDGTLGDVSGDGKVTMYDAALVLRFTLGSNLTDTQKTAADKNGDGKIDGADVVVIARKALGL